MFVKNNQLFGHGTWKKGPLTHFFGQSKALFHANFIHMGLEKVSNCECTAKIHIILEDNFVYIRNMNSFACALTVTYEIFEPKVNQKAGIFDCF